ncbi:MAG: hypothetical protein R3C32_06465 [Chloroflexota bacterium]
MTRTSTLSGPAAMAEIRPLNVSTTIVGVEVTGTSVRSWRRA